MPPLRCGWAAFVVYACFGTGCRMSSAICAAASLADWIAWLYVLVVVAVEECLLNKLKVILL